MESLVNSVKSMALNVGEYFTPVLKESKFKETGVLTPDEFVAAGDYLVFRCPTWRWSKAVDQSRTRNYLPVDKQFLITRNVPCYRRCKDMEYDPSHEKILHGKDIFDEDGFISIDDDDEGWVDTHHFAPVMVAQNMELDEDMSVEPIEMEAGSGEAADLPAMDMDAFIAGGGLEIDDPNRFVVRKTKKPNFDEEDTILRTRTYDLHITYDKYYQVPRLWLCGYDEANEPLSVEKMSDDFSQDHINKTITMETHPHLHSVQMASIHPCRHAEVMKRLMDQLAESGKDLCVEQYLLIFLKFVQAVIPTIEHDYTQSVQL